MSLDEIRVRADWLRANSGAEGTISTAGLVAAALASAEDVPVLLAEIDRLTAHIDEQDAMIGGLMQDVDMQTRAAFENQAEADRLARELDTMREVAQGNKRHVAYLTAELESGVPVPSSPGDGPPLDELLAQHDWDELVFGGFICLKCTPDDAAIPEENVYWPCPPLRAAGMTDEHARGIVIHRREEVEARARAEAAQRAKGGGS